MGCKGDLASQLQKDGSGDTSAAAEQGSEEEEPYEREFYDDDDEPDTEDVDPCDDPLPEEEASGEEPCGRATLPEDEDASDEEPFDVELCDEEGEVVPDAHNTCRKQLYEVEPCDDLVAHEEEFVEKKFSAVQAIKKEQNKQDFLKQVLRKGNSNEQKEVQVTDEMEKKPFKKRLSVRFAADVSCYTYSSDSFGAAKLEKRKAQFDDQDKHLCKRQEHTLSLPQDGRKLNEADNTNLYVGNLPASVVSHKLVELFIPFGRIVRSRVIDGCFTGLSKGYGFVKYADPHCAAAAIKHMNGRLVEGKTLEVRVAGVPPSGSNPSMQSVLETYSQPSKEIDRTSLYICNLPLSMNTEKLVEHFLPFGEVTSAKVTRDYTTGLSKGYGFVKYSDSHHAAEAVIHLNGRLVEGKKIEVRVSGISPTLSNSAVESHANTRTVKEIDMTNLYVCNIPSSIDTKRLVELFLPFGKITHVRVAADQATNSGKGYGFIKFADSQSAAEAIALMNGALIEGEMVIVRVAGLSPSTSSSAVQCSPHSVPNPSPEINKSRLYITNLPQSTTADKLVNLFMPFGQINKVVMNQEYSLVYYADVPSAITAVEHMDGYLIGGKRLAVKRSEPCTANAAEHALSPAGKPMKEIDMADVFVGRLPSTITGDQLVELFRPFGQIVQARIFQFHGYGMVRYGNPSAAAAAIDHMDGYQIGGSTLVVRLSGLPGESSAATSAPTLQMPGNEQRQIDMTNLYVCHLPLFVTTEKLIEIFLPCGQITRAKVVADRYTGASKGFGFVQFADPCSAAVALTHMNGYPLEGHILEVRIAGVHPSDMGSYMVHLYSQFTSPDPSRMAVGIPISYWPYYCAESAYGMLAENEGQGTASATDAASQTSQQEGLPESVLVSSVAEKDCSPVSNRVTDSSQPQSSVDWAGPPGFEPHTVCSQPQSSVGWAGPPGFEPHVVPKKGVTVMNPSQPCSKFHLAQSGGRQKRRSIV